DGSAYGVYARRFAAAGAPLTGDVAVNTVTTGAQSAPAVAVGSAGDFVIAWTSIGQDGDGQGVYARRFNAAAAPPVSEFRVNTVTTGDQTTPAVAMNAAGDFLVAWASNGQDGSGLGVYAQRYTATAAVGSVPPTVP